MILTVKQCLANAKQRLGAIGLRWASADAPRTRAFGVDVIDLTRDGSGAEAMELTVRVLELLREASPRALTGLARRSPRIAIVRGYPWAGQYWHYFGGIALEASVVERQIPMSIAMTIVHEATHARIAAAGVPYLPQRSRIERMCIRQEIEFAETVPGTDSLIEGAQRKLALEA